MDPPRAQTPFSWLTIRLLQFQSLSYPAVDYEQGPSAVTPGPLIPNSYPTASPGYRQMID